MHPAPRSRRLVVVGVAAVAALTCTTVGVAMASTHATARPALTPAVSAQLRHVAPGSAARPLTAPKPAPAAAAQAFKPSARFTLVARLVGEPTFVDADGSKGLSAGDRALFDEKLFADGGKREVGTLHNECTYQAGFDFDAPLDLGADCKQFFVFTNVRGRAAQLVGLGQNLRDDQFAIVGGTQALRSATGTVTITSQNADQTESQLLVELTLPKR